MLPVKIKNLERLLVPWIALFILGSLPACHSIRLAANDPPPTRILYATEPVAKISVSVTIVPSATPIAPTATYVAPPRQTETSTPTYTLLPSTATSAPPTLESEPQDTATTNTPRPLPQRSLCRIVSAVTAIGRTTRISGRLIY